MKNIRSVLKLLKQTEKRVDEYMRNTEVPMSGYKNIWDLISQKEKSYVKASQV